jgi:histidine triad (HIT) family protein
VSSDDCLFCRLAGSGEHVAATPNFVAIRDINPKADVHLLVLPKRHLATFREVGQLTEGEAKEMLDFIADTARGAGLDDYQARVHVGAGGGQEIFHLHWHILGSSSP